MTPFGWFVGNQIIRFAASAGILLALIHYLTVKAKWRSLVSGLFVLLLIVEFFHYVPFHAPRQPGARQDKVRVLTFNSQQMESSGWLPYWNKTKADLVCVHEVDLSRLDGITAFAASEGWYIWSVPTGSRIDSGSMIFSRSPIMPTDTIPLPTMRRHPRRALVAETTVEGKPVTVVAVHLEPIRDNHRPGGTMGDNWRIRRQQAELLVTRLESVPEPVVVCGDFNATPTDRSIAPLTVAFTDSWEAHGNGLGGTWEGYLSFFRIDYILYRGFSYATGLRIVRFNNSDHRCYEVTLFR